jgi:hypothetical protein
MENLKLFYDILQCFSTGLIELVVISELNPESTDQEYKDAVGFMVENVLLRFRSTCSLKRAQRLEPRFNQWKIPVKIREFYKNKSKFRSFQVRLQLRANK